MAPRRAGLDHAVFPLHAKKIGVKKRRRIAVFEGVQIMECAALDVWARMSE